MIPTVLGVAAGFCLFCAQMFYLGRLADWFVDRAPLAMAVWLLAFPCFVALTATAGGVSVLAALWVMEALT